MKTIKSNKAPLGATQKVTRNVVVEYWGMYKELKEHVAHSGA